MINSFQCDRDARGLHFSTGFTLLEILLVIVILSVTTMMVAPSFVSVSSPSIRDEAIRLAQLVRMAADESMLSGSPIRLSVKRHSYAFETPDKEGKWSPVNDEIYRSYRLAEAFMINEIRPQSGLGEKLGKEDEEPVIGRILLLPTGIQLPSKIVLSEGNIKLGILIQPGPEGIRIAEAGGD